jgi:hypothetical protein
MKKLIIFNIIAVVMLSIILDTYTGILQSVTMDYFDIGKEM